jgi:hypothetical protein
VRFGSTDVQSSNDESEYYWYYYDTFYEAADEPEPVCHNDWKGDAYCDAENNNDNCDYDGMVCIYKTICKT